MRRGMHVPAPASPFFVVKITGVSSDRYTFEEWWLNGAGTWEVKSGGRRATAYNPGVALSGTFAVGDFALARQGEGCGGNLWELLAVPTAMTAADAGCGWMAGIRTTNCIGVTRVSASGDCSCDDPVFDLTLAYDSGAGVWTSVTTIEVCGESYAVVFARSNGASQFYLASASGGSGGSATYYGTLDYCDDGTAVWAFSDAALCTGTADEGCDNVLRLRIRCSGCGTDGNLPPVTACDGACEMSECLTLVLSDLVAGSGGACSTITEGMTFNLRRIPGTYNWESPYTEVTVGAFVYEVWAYAQADPTGESCDLAYRVSARLRGDTGLGSMLSTWGSVNLSGTPCLPAAQTGVTFHCHGATTSTATVTIDNATCDTEPAPSGDCCPGSPDTLTCAVTNKTGDCSALADSYTFTRFVGEAWLSDAEMASGIWGVLSCGMFGVSGWRLNLDGVADDGTDTVVGSIACCPSVSVAIDYTFGTGGLCTGSARFTFTGTC